MIERGMKPSKLYFYPMISRLWVGGLSIIWQRIFLILVWQTGK